MRLEVKGQRSSQRFDPEVMPDMLDKIEKQLPEPTRSRSRLTPTAVDRG